jgi:hypothetical protein
VPGWVTGWHKWQHRSSVPALRRRSVPGYQHLRRCCIGSPPFSAAASSDERGARWLAVPGSEIREETDGGGVGAGERKKGEKKRKDGRSVPCPCRATVPVSETRRPRCGGRHARQVERRLRHLATGSGSEGWLASPRAPPRFLSLSSLETARRCSPTGAKGRGWGPEAFSPKEKRLASCHVQQLCK